MNIKVAITDDHPVVANGIKKILADFTHIDVVAIYTSGKEMMQDIANTKPDVLLLDMNLPGEDGQSLAKDIVKNYADIKIVVFSSSDVIIQVRKMLQLGCMGYILKDADDLTIVKAIETVHGGGQFLSSSIEQRLIDTMFKSKQQDEQTLLTRREKEVLELIMQELTNQEIADKLFISLHTVDNHRANLLQKLKVKNTAGLVKKAMEKGLID